MKTIKIRNNLKRLAHMHYDVVMHAAAHKRHPRERNEAIIAAAMALYELHLQRFMTHIIHLGDAPERTR